MNQKKEGGGMPKFKVPGAGFILDALAGFVDFGYKLVDGAERIVGKIFGEEGAKKFRTFMENLTNLVNAFFIFLTIAPKTLSLSILNIKNEFINAVKFLMKVLNFSAPSSPKILVTNCSAPSAILYPKSTKVANKSNRPPATPVITLNKGCAILKIPRTFLS